MKRKKCKLFAHLSNHGVLSTDLREARSVSTLSSKIRIGAEKKVNAVAVSDTLTTQLPLFSSFIFLAHLSKVKEQSSCHDSSTPSHTQWPSVDASVGLIWSQKFCPSWSQNFGLRWWSTTNCVITETFYWFHPVYNTYSGPIAFSNVTYLLDDIIWRFLPPIFFNRK